MSTVHRLAVALLTLVGSAALPVTAAAHAELVDSEPADGAVLDAPPRQVVLTFDDELDPDSSRFAVTDAGGGVVGEGEVDLQVADRNVLRGDVVTEAGASYTVSWTITGSDGHPIEGTLAFSVDEAEEAAGETPDTAVPLRRSPILLVPASVALLAAAILAGRLRPRRNLA